jgi:hypothetical protein
VKGRERLREGEGGTRQGRDRQREYGTRIEEQSQPRKSPSLPSEEEPENPSSRLFTLQAEELEEMPWSMPG